MADDEKQLERRGTVLVVDDEESIRDSLRMVLEYKNHKVVEASGGAEALRRVLFSRLWCSRSCFRAPGRSRSRRPQD